MDFVGNLSLFAAVKKFTNRLKINKVITMVMLAQFFRLTVYIYIHIPKSQLNRLQHIQNDLARAIVAALRSSSPGHSELSVLS